MTVGVKQNTINRILSPGNSTAQLSATDFLDCLRRDDLSVLEYATACADQIEKFDPDLKAWIWYDRDRFLTKAAEADRTLECHRSAEENACMLPSSLFGVPIGVKDIFNTEDMPTCHGSRLFKGYFPGNDARVVTSLKGHGAIMAGKTVTAEFAVHHPGETKNPHSLARTSGTSSSGSAAAVASGMVPVALASQTGGSTIRPSSYCGVFGFKPSYGALPRTAMLKTTDTLDSVGLMSRSVDDLQLAFDAMRVRGWNYPISDAAYNDPTRRMRGKDVWRVGVLNGPKSTGESSAAKSGMKNLTTKLAHAGCEISDCNLPQAFDNAHEVHETIYCRSLSYHFRMEWEADDSAFSETLASMILRGSEISTEDYMSAVSEQTHLASLFDCMMNDFDVVVCPSTVDEAPIADGGVEVDDHCLIFTLCHAAAVSLPLFSGTTGLPLGLQVASRRFNDYLLLDFARFLTSSY